MTIKKISNTTIRVSKLFLELLERPMDFNEMFDFFNKQHNTNIYSTEVLNKYINTLRAIGLKIKRINGKYHLLNSLTNIHLSKNEIAAFKELEIKIIEYGTNKNLLDFISLKRKILKFCDETTQKNLNMLNTKFFNSELGIKIKLFQNLCEDEQKIKIEYNNKEYIIEPKEVFFIENKPYLKAYNNTFSNINQFEIEKIKLFKQQPLKNTQIEIKRYALYELSGKLAKTYKIKEGEIIIAKHDTKIFIKCELDDYEILAKRLIRYKEFCKIINPTDFKEYFLNYTNNILKIYEN